MKINELPITVKKFRESRNLTQLELAKKSELGSGTIGDIESGKNKARTTTLEKIAKALNLNSDERRELFASTLPQDINIKLNKIEKIQYDEFMGQATLMFNDETISEEDKEKLFKSLQELFFETKFENKKKNS